MFALVFYTQSRTKDVVPITSIPTGAECGDVTRVRYSGRQYKAKILHIGARELCELKATAVTSDGDLLANDFDTTAPFDEDDVAVVGDDEEIDEERMRPSHSEKELIVRIIKIEDMVAVGMENENAIKAEVTALNQRIERMEHMLQEILRRIPAVQKQGEIAYSYASAKSVAELRQLKGLNMSHFVLALEMEVYQDDISELEILVDNRIQTKDRVLFIQQCLFKYYDTSPFTGRDLEKSQRILKWSRSTSEENNTRPRAHPKSASFPPPGIPRPAIEAFLCSNARTAIDHFKTPTILMMNK